VKHQLSPGTQKTMSHRLTTTFAHLHAANRAAFVPFIMAGDPDRVASQQLLDGLPAAGADIIELGLPFSDPMADGPSIQAAGLRALQASMTVAGALAMVRAFRSHNNETPLILMGYYNPVYSYGPERFARDAVDAGVDGVILVDLPPEEEAEFASPARAAGLDLIRLVSPVTDGQRLTRIARSASGFLYYVALTGVTGAQAARLEDTTAALVRIRAASPLPVGVGFGIRTPDQAAAVAQVADAVIVGSAIVDQITATLDRPQAVEETLAFAAALARAVATARTGTLGEPARTGLAG
jgi:tryptophan synthase alpha chain